MLTFKIRLPEVPVSAEDIYSNAVGLLFPDNLRTFHGDPGSHITYVSKRFGDMELSLVDPHDQDERVLFAHHIWNSGIQMAEFISDASDPTTKEGGERDRRCDVNGRNVLELGSGTGLEGIVSVLAGAEEVVLTDYPSPAILANASANVERNVPKELRQKLTVRGHEWGVLTDDFSKTHANHFSRILCADCLWMDGEHYALAQSMEHFLSHKDDARVWVIAGFHTGRAKLASFFDIAAQAGLETEKIWERDADGNEREWVRERNGGQEDATGRNKWLVVAILRRQQASSVGKVGKRDQFFASMLMQKSNRHV